MPGPSDSLCIIQAPFPRLEKDIIAQLTAIRQAGIPVSIQIARAVILAHVRRVDDPKLQRMKFCITWVRMFLRSILGWADRASTRPAKKVPKDVHRLGLHLHARLSYAIRMYGISDADLVVNMDHTGVSLIPLGNRTWEKKGSKQVETINHGEKKQVRTTYVIFSFLLTINAFEVYCSHWLNMWREGHTNTVDLDRKYRQEFAGTGCATTS